VANLPYSISKDEINASHQRIKPFIHRTPILTSSLINQLADCNIYFIPMIPFYKHIDSIINVLDKETLIINNNVAGLLPDWIKSFNYKKVNIISNTNDRIEKDLGMSMCFIKNNTCIVDKKQTYLIEELKKNKIKVYPVDCTSINLLGIGIFSTILIL